MEHDTTLADTVPLLPGMAGRETREDEDIEACFSAEVLPTDVRGGSPRNADLPDVSSDASDPLHFSAADMEQWSEDAGRAEDTVACTEAAATLPVFDPQPAPQQQQQQPGVLPTPPATARATAATAPSEQQPVHRRQSRRLSARHRAREEVDEDWAAPSARKLRSSRRPERRGGRMSGAGHEASHESMLERLRSEAAATVRAQKQQMYRDNASTLSLPSSSDRVFDEDGTGKKEVKLEKNRQSARECRRRKKEYIRRLEAQLKSLINANHELVRNIEDLEHRNQQVRRRHVATAVPVLTAVRAGVALASWGPIRPDPTVVAQCMRDIRQLQSELAHPAPPSS